MASCWGVFIPPIFAPHRRIEMDGSDLIPPSWARFGPGGWKLSRPRPRLRPGRERRPRAARPRADSGDWAEFAGPKRTEAKKKEVTQHGLGRVQSHVRARQCCSRLGRCPGCGPKWQITFFFQKQLYAYLIKFCTDFIAFLCIILSNDNFIRRTVKYSDVSGK